MNRDRGSAYSVRPRASGRFINWTMAVLTVAALAGCEPADRTPGLWLSGEQVDTFPHDWAFTDNYQEVFVEVSTPYFIPHSVTIWCAQVDGELFIGARDPETKNWPGWMEKNRDIRLKIGDKLYDVATANVSDEHLLDAIRTAYAEKYQLSPPADGKPRNVRYWAVVPRG